MKRFNWDPAKNEQLKKERDVSFELVILCIEDDRILDVLEHSNPEKYIEQKIYVLEMNNYAYLVPFEDRGEERILRTMIPSRKFTNKYLRRD